MTGLDIVSVKKSYDKTDVLHDINLSIAKGEFIVFVGPSGCGKSTLLRMIAGLEDITSGTISIEGQVVNDLSPSDRGIAMVFQSYALYPHMTVYDNMAFGLKMAKVDKAIIDKRVREAADMLQITKFLDRLPKALSGGQRQRVAIGRAITRDPKVFLFDEPLSNLDAALRVATRIEIAGLKERMPDTTMIYVTHDQVEAMTLADRIVVLSGGYVEQVGTPLELYNNPYNLFVAQFIGSPAMNILSAKRADEGLIVGPEAHLIKIDKARMDKLGQATFPKLGVRPEHLHKHNDNPDFTGTVSLVEHLGELTMVYVDVGGDEPVVAKLDGTDPVVRGEKIGLKAELDHLHVFDDNGKAVRA
jgi:alpha-glucoside transport system ATP-binding protein